MKYIDAKKLRSEVERLKETGCEAPILVCDDILSFINYLEEEQHDVDFEKEIDDYFNAWQNVLCDEDCCNEGGFCCVLDENLKPVDIGRCRKVAKHFYERGTLNARKEK